MEMKFPTSTDRQTEMEQLLPHPAGTQGPTGGCCSGPPEPGLARGILGLEPDGNSSSVATRKELRPGKWTFHD